MIGTKSLNNILVAIVIVACLGMVTKRLVRIFRNYTLQGLINHEEGH